MSKFKMTVFSEIPVHPITLDEVKGGLANPLGDCPGAACNCNGLTVVCNPNNCGKDTAPCSLESCPCNGSYSNCKLA